MSRSRNILLLGSNDRAGLETCRSLGRVGHRVTTLRLSAQRTPADHSRFCAESLYIGSPDSGVREYVAKLTDLLGSRRYDYLIPIDDLSCELTYSNYDAISSLTRVVGPSPASYTTAHNQFEALALTESSVLARPATILVKRGQVPPVPSFPCFVRPVFSSAIVDDEPQTFSVRKVYTADELDAKLRDDLPRVDVMLQAPIAGAGVGLHFCAIDGNVLGAVVTLRLHEPLRGVGSSYRKTEEISPQIVAVMQNIARQLSWTGFMTIECKRAKNRLFFMDFNGWPWGSISLPIFAGVDFPKLLIDGLEGRRSPSIALPTRTVYTRHLRTDIGWLFTQLVKGVGLKVIVPWINSLGRVLIGRERFDIERVEDPLPAIRQFDSYIKSFGVKIGLRLTSAFRRSAVIQLKAGSLDKTSSLLVVCQGNINRSVVAEHLFKARGFTCVRSAGLLGMSGRRPSKPAEAFLTERLGIDASKLRSRSVTRALKETANIDMVLCFERRQVAEIVRQFPNLRGKVFLFSQLARDDEDRQTLPIRTVQPRKHISPASEGSKNSSIRSLWLTSRAIASPTLRLPVNLQEPARQIEAV